MTIIKGRNNLLGVGRVAFKNEIFGNTLTNVEFWHSSWKVLLEQKNNTWFLFYYCLAIGNHDITLSHTKVMANKIK